MIQVSHNDVGPNHPIRPFFQALTERGMAQTNVRDEETASYIANLLTEFVRTEDMYRVRDDQGQRLEYLADLMTVAHEATDADIRRDHYKHLGDLTLFMLGLFPERLDRPRRIDRAGYYAEQGRRSYNIVADLEWSHSDPAVYRKLSDQFEQYVLGLNWVKLYINDPFFQYMFREFGIS